jgi:predicted phosphodiesterase
MISKFHLFNCQALFLLLSHRTRCGMSRCMPHSSFHGRQIPDKQLIGIVADSHGQAEPLANGLAFLRKKGCGTLYHLGDICDSLHPETADTCVGLLLEFGVTCVKGNNDHAVVVSHEGRKSASVHADTVDYLRGLPLVIEQQSSLLAHSLPFERELGLACMVGAMNRRYALQYFRQFNDRILFRGHSHTPEVIQQDRHGGLVPEAIFPGQTIEIKKRTAGIVTCGALDHGLCLLWSPEDGRITSLKF